MAITAISGGTQVFQTSADRSGVNGTSGTAASTNGASKIPTSKTSASKTTAKKDDTAEFIDQAEKLILDPKSTTDEIMKFLKKEVSGGKLSQEKQLALQELFQTRREASDLMSNIFRMLADAALGVIRNIH